MVAERGISGSSTKQSHWSSCAGVSLGRARSEDARVALLESVCVALVLHTGREIQVEPTLAATEAPPRDSVLGRWAQLDDANLQEELLNSVPIQVAVKDESLFRCRFEGETPRQVGGTLFVPNQSMEIVLSPKMLLRRPHKTGSLGRDELSQLVVKFQRDQWAQL